MPRKASDPIVGAAIDCKRMDAKFVQYTNALFPMLVTLLANGDARQASAVLECVIPDAGDAVGNGDARQASAVIECATRDDSHWLAANIGW